ncbi:MAG: hypothetical protein BGN88_12565 [Clostridiales bacterium 43-6]|nr:MAG: hypothetical protein BGN88_12565 [Clostridiales bacterium 43-6]
MEQFIGGFASAWHISVEVYRDEKQLTTGKMGTGLTVRIKLNSAVAEQYTTVVYGDIDGTGKIDAIDIVYAKKHVLKISLLKDVKLMAANADRSTDNKVNAIDILKLKQEVLKIKQIKQN